MHRIETVTPDQDQAVRLLRNDELDAVSGGKGGDKPVEFLVVKLKEVFITSVQPSPPSQ
jgi:hypothetical protein